MIKDATYIKVKDHSVSGEEFQLCYNDIPEMLETRPQPTLEKLQDYYKSEDYISHTDSKRNLFEKVYHQIRRISLKRKLKLINSFDLESSKLLDIGCGTGDFLQLAGGTKWKIAGIEPNEKARALANIKTKDAVFDVDQLQKWDSNIFDVITLWHVLEHLPKLKAYVSILKSLLKPDGVMIIAVPNYKSFDASHYKEFWAAYDVPRHLWHFSQNSISTLVEIENMKVVETLPLKWDSYYVSLLSEKYKSGRMNIFKAFSIGWQSNFKARRTNEYSSLIYVIKNS